MKAKAIFLLASLALLAAAIFSAGLLLSGFEPPDSGALLRNFSRLVGLFILFIMLKMHAGKKRWL